MKDDRGICTGYHIGYLLMDSVVGPRIAIDSHTAAVDAGSKAISKKIIDKIGNIEDINFIIAVDIAGFRMSGSGTSAINIVNRVYNVLRIHCSATIQIAANGENRP